MHRKSASDQQRQDPIISFALEGRTIGSREKFPGLFPTQPVSEPRSCLLDVRNISELAPSSETFLIHCVTNCCLGGRKQGQFLSLSELAGVVCLHVGAERSVRSDSGFCKAAFSADPAISGTASVPPTGLIRCRTLLSDRTAVGKPGSEAWSCSVRAQVTRRPGVPTGRASSPCERPAVDPIYVETGKRYPTKKRAVSDPTTLILVD